MSSQDAFDELPLSEQAARLQPLAERAVSEFGLAPHSSVSMHWLGENAIFSVKDSASSDRYALRIHRPRYRTDDQIKSEIAWMTSLREGVPGVPEARAGPDGEYLRTVAATGVPEPRQCDLLTWIDATPLRRLEPADALPMMGEVMAKIHQHGRTWQRPGWFTRLSWGFDDLVGTKPRLGDYTKVELDGEVRRLLDRTMAEVRLRLADCSTDSDSFGLIHADYLDNNLFADNGNAVILDFDECGFGWFTYDLATLRVKGRSLTDDANWMAMFLDSYRRRSDLALTNLSALPAFMAARAVGMVGWMYGRGSYAEKFRKPIVDDAIYRAKALLGG